MDSGFRALGFIGLRVPYTTGLAYASGQGTAGSTKATVMMATSQCREILASQQDTTQELIVFIQVAVFDCENTDNVSIPKPAT